MELVEGETLAELLARESPSTEEAVAILRAVAEGLAAVHAGGIVHRDVKPANVMIERSTGRPVLMDFGFAADLDVKQSRRVVGTPSFWAPEQARGEPATPASDVYSLGLIAYRLLTGSDFSLSARDALARVPRRYRRFVAACVAPRPRDRPRDAAAALDLLRAGYRPVLWVAVAGAAAVAVTLGSLRTGAVREPIGTPTPLAASADAPRQPAPASTAPVESASLTAAEPPPSQTAAPVEPPRKSRPAAATTAVARHPPGGGAGPTSSGPPAPPAPSAPPAPANDPLYRH
jgi:serine/threonine-protein kinase